jgi:transaldolase/glucose-6-phosphate isomerase
MAIGTKNPLKGLQDYGQSIWLDYLRRSLITGGELERLIEEDGLRGITSNPSIFEKAIAGSTDYTVALEALERAADRDAMAIYEHLAIEDIQMAADVLRPVYEETAGRDGYVSMEVSPYLARDTQGTIEEARRLSQAIGRDNTMIKVPASPEGIPAIAQLTTEGINVNITLLFGLERYEEVVEAYLTGLEQLAGRGGNLGKVASVASFFVSRVDTAVDALIAERLKTAPGAGERALLRSLAGKVAIANARLAYQRYREWFRGPRWDALARRGARTQRLLWASTSAKNPNFRDVLYVEELIGADTINTVPPATLDAFRDHGRLRASLEDDVEGAHDTLETLDKVGISLREVTDRLLDDGVRLFIEAFDKLLSAIDQQRRAVPGRCIDRQTSSLPEGLAAAVKTTFDAWHADGKVRRLWARDASLWTGTDEASWLGWLGIAEDQLADADRFRRVAEEVRVAGFTHALLLGMGGSSLCPEVLATTFGRVDGYPRLHVLDSTDPAQIKRVEDGLDLARTLVIVSSKSGTTLEPNILKDYFFERIRQVVGPAEAGARFVAITDPGSKLERVAESDSFRHTFFGLPSIGGRYSALSDFGMVPAAIAGIDVARFLDRADVMAHSCARSLPPQDNPAVVLGTILGVAANQGRDKVTLVASPGISGLGAWLEQLLAESTGKDGKGVIPVDREALGPPEMYGDDRVFAYLRLDSAPDPAQDVAIDALERAGHPVVRIAIADVYELGQEFFRWELATAVAGAIIGINPFDQPDVEESKAATRTLAAAYERTGALPQETPLLQQAGITLFTDEKNAAALSAAMGTTPSLVDYLKAHLDRLRAGDYFATLAYVDMNRAYAAHLQAIRHAVRDARHVATALGFGPRFLHSTGQAYKGGPNSGVFLQITCDDAVALSVPGRRYTFGVVKAAQARGDFHVLAERDRRALRVHLGPDVPAGLERLRAALEQALA